MPAFLLVLFNLPDLLDSLLLFYFFILNLCYFYYSPFNSSRLAFRILLSKHQSHTTKMSSLIFRTINRTFRFQTRAYSTPRHLLSIADLTPKEFSRLVLNAAVYKNAFKAGGSIPEKLKGGLLGQPAVALMFSKRSTRTRVSTESAVAMLGGQPMFLGKDDIQLGVRLLFHVPCFCVPRQQLIV